MVCHAGLLFLITKNWPKLWRNLQLPSSYLNDDIAFNKFRKWGFIGVTYILMAVYKIDALRFIVQKKVSYFRFSRRNFGFW